MGFIVTLNSDLFNIDYIRRSLIRIQLNFTASYCNIALVTQSFISAT